MHGAFASLSILSKNAKPKPFYSEPWGQVFTDLHPKHAVQCARGRCFEPWLFFNILNFSTEIITHMPPMALEKLQTTISLSLFA
jgi:hypothetical protein